MSPHEIIMATLYERDRQNKLKADGKFNHTCADAIHAGDKATILGEEFGEVCRAVCDNDIDGLRDELVQVMAVAMAWLESLD